MTVNPVHKTVLSNGVRVLSRHIPHVQTVSVGVWVHVGARDESMKENGLSHFIEHMLFKGTRSRSAYQIAKEFDVIGGHSNAFTSTEYTCYHARAIDTHLPTITDILGDIFLNSEFSEREIENERPVVLSEVDMLEDSPEEFVHTLLEENFWEGHPLGRSILGSPKNIKTFNSQNVKAFFRDRYQPGRIIISAAGNVTHQQVLDLVGPSFEAIGSHGHFPDRNQPDIRFHTRLHRKKLEQVHLGLGIHAPTLTSPSRFACSLLNTILGGNMSSRLFQEIREKRGLAYSIYSFNSLNSDAGMFGIYTGVSSKNVTQSLSLILDEMDKISRESVDEAELQNAKDYTKGNILLSSESTESHMFRMAQNELHFGRFIPIQETISNIQNVTVEDIRQLAHDLFKTRRPSLTLLGPFKNQIELDKLLDDF